MVAACRFSFILPALLWVGCRGDRPREEDSKLTGTPISHVIQILGDPDEVAEAQYFGTKFDRDSGPLAAVFKYSKEELYVYING